MKKSNIDRHAAAAIADLVLLRVLVTFLRIREESRPVKSVYRTVMLDYIFKCI